jgi:hypothetical protein
MSLSTTTFQMCSKTMRNGLARGNIHKESISDAVWEEQNEKFGLEQLCIRRLDQKWTHDWFPNIGHFENNRSHENSHRLQRAKNGDGLGGEKTKTEENQHTQCEYEDPSNPS